MESHPSQAFRHAKDRAAERYEVRLTTKKHKQIIYQIRSGKAIFLRIDNNTGRTQWLVKMGRLYAKIVFCPKLSLIITVMPLNREDYRILKIYK